MVLNVTVTQPVAAGYLTVYPDGVARAGTSNLNFLAGQSVPNLVIVPVGADGKVDFYNGSGGTVQVIADVSGWFASGTPAAGGLGPLPPARIMDTRKDLGANGPVPAGGTVSLTVQGAGGVPSTAGSVGAVVLNVTVTQPVAAGYLTVYPDGVARAGTSNLNFLAKRECPQSGHRAGGSGRQGRLLQRVGRDRPGHRRRVRVVRVGDAGCGRAGPVAACSDHGHPQGSGCQRAGAGGGDGQLDSARCGRGAVDCGFGWGGGVERDGDPARSRPATSRCIRTGWPAPVTSNLNFLAGESVPNLVIVPVGADGKVDFYNGSGGTVQVIADVSGWTSTP